MHFISVIFNEDITESKHSIIDSVINSANVGLLESEFEYELFETANNQRGIEIPLNKNLNEQEQELFAYRLAKRLFAKGYNNFDIDISLTEDETIARTLRRGMRGDDVKRIQREIGMPAADQDGIFGPKTERAVRAFQQKAGIQVDGIVGQQTQSAILKTRMPNSNIAIQQPGAAYIDAPYPQQDNPADKRIPDDEFDDVRLPPGTGGLPRGGNLPRYGAGPGDIEDPQKSKELPSGVGGDQALPKTGQTPSAGTSMFATDVEDKTAEGVWRVADNGDGTFSLVGPDGVVDRSKGSGGRFSAQKRDDWEDYAAQLNREQGLPNDNAPVEKPAIDTNLQPKSVDDVAAFDKELDQYQGLGKGELQQVIRDFVEDDNPIYAKMVLDKYSKLAQVPEGEALDIWRYAYRRGQEIGLTSMPVPPGLDDLESGSDNNPEIDTSPAPQPEIGGAQELGTPDGENYSELPVSQTDTTQPTGTAPSFTAPTIDEPVSSIDAVNDRTQRQMIAQRQWEQKYGNVRDVSAGLPAEFTTQYLNPALEDLTRDAAEALAKELNGAPVPVAVLTMERMRQMLGVENGAEILDMAREVEQEEPDQASALSTLANIYNKLEDTAMPKEESVAPRPKGAFMFRERNEWDSLYGRTHNRDGSKKQLSVLSENKNLSEVTYDCDDKFFEDYGVMWFNTDYIDEAEYQGRKVPLGKPMKGDVKKFKVYVKNPKGNVVKVNFGQKGVKIKKSNPARRRSFRARHNCDNPGPRHKARYWSCRKW